MTTLNTITSLEEDLKLPTKEELENAYNEWAKNNPWSKQDDRKNAYIEGACHIINYLKLKNND